MGEKVVWFIAAILALIAVFVFRFVQNDAVTAGVMAIVCLCCLHFRAQAA